MTSVQYLTKRPKGLFAGLTTVDLVFALDNYPVEDTKNTALAYTAAAGGPACNASVVFSYLGGDAHLVSPVGKSAIAGIARSDLARYGVQHTDIAPSPTFELPLSVIAAASNKGSRTIVTSPTINNEIPEPPGDESIARWLHGIDTLLIDGHQCKLAGKLAQFAKQQGSTVILDGDLYHEEIEGFLRFVDIVIFGKSFVLTETHLNRNIFDYFRSFGIEQIVATQGGEPIRFFSEGRFGFIEIPEIRAVDTLAAGDFFHGAFCFSYGIYYDLVRALSFASKVASSSVTTFGPRDWMDEYEPHQFL